MEPQKVIVHVRFAPNGSVVEIGERPSGRTSQDWFEHLTTRVGSETYQALSGGRGVFRLTREQIEALKAEPS